MNLLIWVEIPPDMEGNEPVLAVMDAAARLEAAHLGKTIGQRRTGKMEEGPNKLVCWDLLDS